MDFWGAFLQLEEVIFLSSAASQAVLARLSIYYHVLINITVNLKFLEGLKEIMQMFHFLLEESNRWASGCARRRG